MPSCDVLHIGFGNYIFLDKVTSFHPVNSIPIRRIIGEAEKQLRCFDATMGKKQRTVFFTTSGLLILSSLDSKSLRARLNNPVGRRKKNKIKRSKKKK